MFPASLFVSVEGKLDMLDLIQTRRDLHQIPEIGFRRSQDSSLFA